MPDGQWPTAVHAPGDLAASLTRHHGNISGIGDMNEDGTLVEFLADELLGAKGKVGASTGAFAITIHLIWNIDASR